jgi:hypothetical protein
MDKRPEVFALAAIFIAPILAIFLADTGTRLADGRYPVWTEFFSDLPTKPALRRTEKRIEEDSWLYRVVRPRTQAVLFETLGQAGADTVVGKNGWFFYRPEIRYLTEPLPPTSGESGTDDPIRAIVSFRDQLAAHGIRLLVVPVPVKASIYPEFLSERASGRGAEVSASSSAFKRRLRDAGVDLVDLMAAFRDRDGAPLYLKTDTHWTPEGAALGAGTTADWLLSRRWIEAGPTSYGLRARPVSRLGDLVAMARSPQLDENVPADNVIGQQVVQGNGKAYSDEPASPVLVLGDSFLRIYQRDAPGAAGFIAHLALRLRCPLDSIVSDGGASTLVRQELSGRPGSLAGKRVVIWEFVERDYRFGTEGWRDIRLPPDLFKSP